MPRWRRNPSIIALPRGELVSFPSGGKPCRITCMAGRLWVTASGRAADSTLEAGEEVTIGGRGTIVVEALRSASVRLEIVGAERVKARALSPQPAR